jgi:SLT domain-containing protein
MPKLRVASLLLIAVPAAAPAQSMNADYFYKRAMALKAKGPVKALLSRDLKPLAEEAKAAGLKVRSARLAAVAAGEQPRYCPPKGSKRMGHDEFLKRMSAMPAAERASIDMTEAMTRIMVKKFPCRG